jgi:hypothetical protein
LTCSLSIQPGVLIDTPDFIRFKHPEFTRPHFSETKRSIGNAPYSQDGMTDGFAHALYLPVPALVEFHPEPCGAGQLAEYFGTGGSSCAFIEFDTGAQAFQRTGLRVPFYFYLINLRYSIARMKQPVRELPVIGEKQQPFGIEVKPSHWKDAEPEVGEEIENGGAAPGIASGCDAVSRFMKQEVDPLILESNDPSVEPYLISQRIYTTADFRFDTVYLDAPLPNQLFRGPPGGNAGPGKKLLQPNLFHLIASPSRAEKKRSFPETKVQAFRRSCNAGATCMETCCLRA